ncbi:VOC family protein [Rhodococcus sp. IEGM 1237]|nr:MULTISPECIES: VOC family protein [Rhodococcus]MDI9960809.1 VOC family protein [Rhodococcus sp. IEGM 1237]
MSYYCDVFTCRVALREREAALLLTPDDFQIYMYVQKDASRPNISNIGVRYVMWSADTEEELARIGARLRAYDASTFTQVVGGVTFVDGCDPDGIRVIVAYPSPEQLPRELIAPRFHG